MQIYDLENPKITEDAGAIYGIFASGELVYIGQTKSITQRMNQHSKNPKFKSCRFSYLPCADYWKRKIIEKWLIQRYRPDFNFAYAVPLKGRLDGRDEGWEASLLERQSIWRKRRQSFRKP